MASAVSNRAATSASDSPSPRQAGTSRSRGVSEPMAAPAAAGSEPRTGELADQPPGRRGRDHPLTAGQQSYVLDRPVRLGALRQEPGGRGQRAEHVLVASLYSTISRVAATTSSRGIRRS